MLLANFNRKEHLRHRAVSLRQHGFLVVFVLRPPVTVVTWVGIAAPVFSYFVLMSAAVMHNTVCEIYNASRILAT